MESTAPGPLLSRVCGGVRCRPGGSWYSRLAATSTIGPVVPGPRLPYAPPSTFTWEVDPLAPILEPRPMINDIARRSWRIALTVGPLAAIALSLAAGLKWR
jgi:hypothetical protein